MVRWWWFGPAVTRAELGRQLTAMADAGIGGVEVAFVYPLGVLGHDVGDTRLIGGLAAAGGVWASVVVVLEPGGEGVGATFRPQLHPGMR